VYDHLLHHRKLINMAKPNLKWTDGQLPDSDILKARMQAKYYGAGYIVLRPYLFHALQWPSSSTPNLDLLSWQQEYNPIAPNLPKHITDIDHLESTFSMGLPNRNVTMAEVVKDPQLAKTFLWCCKKCIENAMCSTEAFDGVAFTAWGKRPRVTNIHGTATAYVKTLISTVAGAIWFAVVLQSLTCPSM
jgi:hypothetical protein